MAILLVTVFLRPAKSFSPYIWRAFLCSILGFFGANILLWVIVLALAKTLDIMNLMDQIQELVGISAGVALLLGPIPVSFLGIILGIVIGVFWAVYVKRRSIKLKQ